MAQMVKVTCYGKTEELTKEEATNKYMEAYAWSDGSERERYANILFGLMTGLTEVSDE